MAVPVVAQHATRHIYGYLGARWADTKAHISLTAPHMDPAQNGTG